MIVAMTERTRAILKAAVQDFIKSNEPVTSERLYEKYDFGIKPAMIRWELAVLADAGYFSQRHPSGGRIPTDKAYRFIAEQYLSEEPVRERNPGAFRGLTENFLKGERKSFVEEVAEEFGVLGVGFLPGEGEFFGSGLDELLEQLGAVPREDLIQVVRDFETLPERILERRSWWEREREWPRVFIGQSPITRSPHLSVLVAYLKREPEDLLMFTIGPKRMDYTRPIRFLKSLEKSIEN
jgi:transcriptional regulator of heat shock response